MNFSEKLKQIKNILFNEEVKDLTFIDARTVDGRIMRAEELMEGESIQEVTENGIVDVDPGEYELEGNIVVVVGEDSIIAEVRQIVVEEELEKDADKQTFANVMRTDGVAIYYEGDEFVEGLTLYLDEELTELAPEGEHFLEGGLRIVIDAEGKLELIEEVVEEFSEAKTEDEKVEEVSFNSQVIEILEKLTNDFNEYKENVTKELEVIKEDFTKFKKEPSVEPTDVKKIDFSKEMDKFEKLKYFSKR